MEFIGYIRSYGDTTNRNRSGFSSLNLLDGVFSYMVDTKSGGDEKKVVKMERYRYIINGTINRDTKNFFLTKSTVLPQPPPPKI
jgi:hypothetical protein